MAQQARRRQARRPSAVRIIGGAHKGQRIRGYGTHSQLRPTTDRTRESLFNCLGQRLDGYHCLDLFAGSGALGLEALSRGAAKVVWVEAERQPANALIRLLRSRPNYDPNTAQVHTLSAYRFLQDNPIARPFDLVFLDPPFECYPEEADWHRLLQAVSPWLAAGAQVYCESAFEFSAEGFTAHKRRKSGGVFWQLLRRDENKNE